MLISHPFLILFITFFLIWIFKKCSYNYKHEASTNPPPSPPSLPILGNLHQMSALMHRSLQSLGLKHGPLMLIRFISRPAVAVQSAEAASEIIKKHDLIFADKPLTTAVRRLLYDRKDVVMAPYGDHWRKLKSVCILQLLSGKRVKSFEFIREEETSFVMKEIKSCCLSRLPVNLSEVFESLSNRVTCRAAFGREYCRGETGVELLRLLREFLEVMGMVSVREFVPWLAWIDRFNGFDFRVERVAREVDGFMEQVIEDHINGGIKSEDESENFVEILVDLYKESSIDRVSVKALILDMLGAGTDTTSVALEWAMTELLRHPFMLKRLRAEVGGIVKPGEGVKESDLAKMQYLKAVVKETLRLHPPVPILAREAREDVRVWGYDIARGTMVMINAWAIGRDPASWDEPEKFQPQRFLDSTLDFKGLDFEFIPFGAGRRGCPGIGFAMSIAELVLANLVHMFEWELPEGKTFEDLDMAEKLGVTLRRKYPLLVVPTHFYF